MHRYEPGSRRLAESVNRFAPVIRVQAKLHAMVPLQATRIAAQAIPSTFSSYIPHVNDATANRLADLSANEITEASPDLGPEYRAKRIPLPTGTSANVALITLSLPRQQQWTPGLAKPYIRVELPAVKPVGKLHNSLATSWQHCSLQDSLPRKPARSLELKPMSQVFQARSTTRRPKILPYLSAIHLFA
jgi:hypothetical protein